MGMAEHVFLTRSRNGIGIVRIIFSTNGISRTYLVHASRLFTSKHFVNSLRGYTGDDIPILRFTFNYRPVTTIWYHWVYNREINTKPEILARLDHQDNRSENQRPFDEYFDLLACLCLGQAIGDEEFKNAALVTLVEKVDNDSNKTALLGCFTQPVVQDIFSLFDAASPVRALIINAMVLFGSIEDIQRLVRSKGYPQDYISGVFVQSFKEMHRFRSAVLPRDEDVAAAVTSVTQKEPTFIRAMRGSMTVDYGRGTVSKVRSTVQLQ
tara:strand:- start:12442 stop:13242 length:801 start_codon:yes stop_codon:yes gene_type:complete